MLNYFTFRFVLRNHGLLDYTLIKALQINVKVWKWVSNHFKKTECLVKSLSLAMMKSND